MKLRVEKAVYGGSGLARVPSGAEDRSDSLLAGKTIFVPYALPGELVEAHIVEDRRGFSTAQLDQVIEPAPERVLPHCEYFPHCGGCQYQQASASLELEMKTDILRDSLARAHVLPNEETILPIEAVASPPWGYRNRVRLHIVPAPGISQPSAGGTVAAAKGGVALCYRERGSHAALSVTHCPIAAPALERAMAAVLGLGGGNLLARASSEIELFTNQSGEQLLVSLWLANAKASQKETAEHLKSFAGELAQKLPGLTGVGVFAGERGDRLIHHWGQTSLLYPVEGYNYRVSLGSFFQVNRFLIPDLLRLAIGARDKNEIRSGGLAWDLYAGVGLFARALDFREVVAVESAHSSWEDLKWNLAGTAHRAVRSTTLDFLRAQGAMRGRARPDLVLLDPPRAGLGKEICNRLAEIAPPRMVYVSCDPATLARDLQTLLHSGYRLESLHLINMFPRTFHLESVAVLRHL